MNPDYESKYDQIYRKTNVDMIYNSNPSKSMSATSAAQSAQQKIMARKVLIKEALLLLAKYKNTRLLLDDMTAQEAWGPMDPLRNSYASYVLRIVDADKRYMKEMLGDWSGVRDTTLILISEFDFEPQYTAEDFQNGVKSGEYDIKTLVELRLATKIYKAYKQANK